MIDKIRIMVKQEDTTKFGRRTPYLPNIESKRGESHVRGGSKLMGHPGWDHRGEDIFSKKRARRFF